MASIMQRRMLSKEDEQAVDEVEVRREDQDKINRFSRLHQRELVVKGELKASEKEKGELDDLAMDLELAEVEGDPEDDLKIQYKIGDSFFHVPLEQAQEMLSARSSEVEEEAGVLQGKLDTLQEEMTQLKVDLYARFGKQINLET